MTNKKLRYSILAAICAISLTSCATSNSVQTDKNEAKPSETVVRFTLSWTPNPNQAGIFVAKEKGWYKEAGIDLEILPYSGVRPTEVIAANAAEAGDTNAEAVLNAYINKTPVTMVHDTQQIPSYGILTLESSGIKNAAELSGKRYADWGSTTIREMVLDAIKNSGAKPEVKTINLAGPDAYNALNQGDVDFTTGFNTVEGERAKLAGKPYRFLPFDEYGIPANPADIGIVLSNKFMKKSPKVAQAFTAATQRGYDWARQNPEKAAEILIKQNPDAKLDPKLTNAIMKELSSHYWKAENGHTGHADLKKWQSYIDYLQSKKLLKDATGQPFGTPIKAEDVVNNEYLKR
ncbi:ABC transporter substrate-binding protein [Actinomycetaceae bacterium TAE3-ERU4]|nr:ABC transporter substrate-binding protein [Actinomycetaceae bacterium TAE3-ERU4]